ncbi:MAG: PHP domain-containing protein [Treponema sp.]|nr:PHP domain-containing protein [Treponema sp.]MCL2251582.1 PHP domain-containing protein [Treponema sp.]
MIDLHTHSNISDGDIPPPILIDTAVKQGLTAIALTDHDTIKGLESAKTAAAQYENFRFIPGIEINIKWLGVKKLPGLGSGGEFHLLGLGINKPSPAFITAVEGLFRLREARNKEILNRMHEFSIDVTWEEIKSLSGGHAVGRPHFAAYMVKKKIVKNVSQAFERYLGVGKPFYVPKEGLFFEEAASLIRESGGVPILAHPISLFIAWGRLPDLITSLKDMGLAGLEAWHPTARNASCRRLEALGKSLGLYITEGSDFHGSVRPDHRLGYSGKYRKINESILEAIPELRQ